jgi:hypothetical protein
MNLKQGEDLAQGLNNQLLLGNYNRPEYVSSPEGYLTALAWNRRKLDRTAIPSNQKVALVFKKRGGNASILTHYTTYPFPGNEIVWANAVASSGIEVDGKSEQLEIAIVDSLAGINIADANSQAAIPLTVNLALLQDRFGMTGKQGSADVGQILEQMFALGKGDRLDSPIDSAALAWESATAHRMTHDKLLSSINTAAESLHPFPVIAGETNFDVPVSSVFQGFEKTPFHWFYENWVKITSEKWIDALPARVWTDWATTILRLSFGLGLIFEAKWFDHLARQILAGEPTEFKTLVKGIDEVLPWVSRTDPQSIRNIAPRLNLPIPRSHALRAEISKWVNSSDLSGHTFSEAVAKMGCDESLKNALQLIFERKRFANVNTLEAIRYALKTRGARGENADLYGLLRNLGSQNRVVLVDPAPDWIAVVASLSCAAPGTSVELGTIQRSLSQIGLNPPRDDLVNLLERAGMTRGSADADQGLLVQSAY